MTRQGGEARGIKLAGVDRKIHRANVHALRQRLVNQIHDKDAGVADVCGGVFQRTVGARLQTENNQRRVFREHIEERKRRRVDNAVGTDSRDQRNGPRHYEPAQELVAILHRQRREIGFERSGHVRAPAAR